ncbi:MAG: ABC transporter permease [Balneola sp.]|nr:MAG: ABC transporter permease [Balneola sp.]
MDHTGFIARRYLFSRKHVSLISTLTYISIVGVTIGTALLIVVLSVFNGFFDVIKNLLLSYDPDIRIESSSATLFKQNQALIDELESIPEIKNYSLYVEGKALLSYRNDRSAVVNVKGIEIENFFKMVNIEESVTSGVFEVEVRNRKPGSVIPEEIRNQLLLTPGDEIVLLSANGMKKALTQITVPRSFRFDVRGTYFLQQVASGPQVFIDLNAAQRLFNSRNSISGIDVKLENNEDAEYVKQNLEVALGDGYKISTWYDLQKPLYDVMYLEKWGAYVILMIIVIVAVLNIIGSLTMIVIQKRRDIGILISMGYGKSAIKNIFRKQGLYIGAIGCGIGGTLGFLLCWIQQEFGIIKLSSAFIIDAYPVDVQLFDVTLVLVGSLLLCLAASWFPSKRASEIQPAEAVRYE